MLLIDTADIIEFAEFILVGLLGFMPLIIIHWADRRPRVRLPRMGKSVWHTAGAIKTSLLIVIANWLQRWMA